MKILAFSDVHGDMKKVRELADRAEREKVDLVILCGDFTYFDEIQPYMIKPFKDKGKKLFFVPGNHESKATAEFLANFYDIKNLDGRYEMHEGVAFFGCGRNMPLNMISDNELVYSLKRSNNLIKNAKKKIMVTHLQPNSKNFERILPGSGSKGLKKVVEEIQPDILICGHIHQAAGAEDTIGKTRVINVARNGRIFEI